MLKVIPSLKYILVGALFFTPTLLFITPAHAEINKYEAHITDSLQVVIPSTSIDVAVDPASKPFDSKDFAITVSTNNATGYYMTMSSDSTNLIKTNDATKTIPTLESLEGGYTSETFTTNKWGYKIGSGNYNAFVSGTRIGGADTTANSDVTILNFATKVDFLQPSGTYQNELTFTVVANPLPTFIQNLDYSLCTTDPMIVVDNRDNQEYTIQRLADGNCWMMNNLNLGAVDLVQDLTKWNTNLEDTISAETFSSWKKTSGSGTYTSAEYIPISNSNYGTMYNYCAASAGSYCYPSDSGTNNAIYDICPKGWRLPTGGTTTDNTNEFNNLYLAYDSDPTAFKAALQTVPAGSFSDGLPNLYTNAYLWSSTFNDANKMYNLVATQSPIYRDMREPRSLGESVRCVLDPTMQGFTEFDADSLAEGSSILLTDARDRQQYNVTKLNGNVWMTRNLAIGCDGTGTTYGSDPTGITLNNYTTNIPHDYTIPTIDLDYTIESDSRMHCDSEYGAYYDFFAAVAENLKIYTAPTGQPFNGTTLYSICPSGWYLPPDSFIESISGTEYLSWFDTAINSGYYYSGNYDRTTYSTRWWGMDSDYSASRRTLIYWTSQEKLEISDYSYWGPMNPPSMLINIRCVFIPPEYFGG